MHSIRKKALLLPFVTALSFNTAISSNWEAQLQQALNMPEFSGILNTHKKKNTSSSSSYNDHYRPAKTKRQKKKRFRALLKKSKKKKKLTASEENELKALQAEYDAKKRDRELYNAVRSSNYEMVKKLVLQKANTNYIRRQSTQESLLHIASSIGDINISRVLVSHGADVGATTIKNWTPMHHATRFGHLNVVKYLMQNGGSMYHVNSDGKNPLALAKQLKHDKIVQFLEIWRKYH